MTSFLPTKWNRKPRAAFTLLEVLVTSAILGIVLFILLSVVSTTLELWRGSRMELSVTREGRAGMALVDNDLRNIIVMTNEKNEFMPWIHTNAFDDSRTVAMQFLTVLPQDYLDKGNKGDICYVEYRYLNQALSRGFANSTVTLDALKKNTFPTLNYPEDFEIVATNVMSARMWGWDANGKDAVLGDGKASPSLRSVGIRLEGVYEEYLRNYLDFSDKIWAADGYRTKQYFHAIYPVYTPN